LGSGGGDFHGPSDIALDSAGSIYVTDGGNQRVEKFNALPTPTVRSTWGGVKRLFR
jgi:DNA-binding beta-propeller fold protein YncE